jgi:hypothetical protein
LLTLILSLLATFIIDPSEIPETEHHVTSKGISTIFGYEGDRWGSGPTRCLKDENGNKRPVNPDLETGDIGIAHRRLDCGAIVYLTNMETGITIRAEVIDAGPWGANSYNPDTGEKFWYVKLHRGDKPKKDKCPSLKCPEGKYRGIVDLTPRAAHLLGHDGWARIHLTYDKRDLRSWKRLEKAKQRQRDRRNQI